MESLSPAAIATTAGALLSLLFNYVPGLNSRFDRLSPDMQRTVMGVVLLISAIGMALWQCSGESESVVSAMCEGGINWRVVLTNTVFALVGNQSADRISPKT
jgi:H+/Cl- antiporter ClcA